MTTEPSTPALLSRHRVTLDAALQAIGVREYWSPYPEHPRAYGEGRGLGSAEGRAAFDALLGRRFDLGAPGGQPGTDGWTGEEVSPYGFALGVSYPHADPDALLPAMRAAMPSWRDAGPLTRALVCLEILEGINARSHTFAHAVMHTSGQAFTMAFQAGGPHAQERGLEAVAHAYREQTRLPAGARWTKPQGRREPLSLRTTFTPVPRGVALVIGCSTFPTWNGFPGLFASLATGNAVLVKPHPRAVLPLALAVHTAREALAARGFDPNLVCLAAERPGEELARRLAVRPEVRIIDYTGSSAFGDWLVAHARQAQVYAEKSGVNSVLIDSTDDYRGMLSNLAFALCLYSGQMCTAPQNLLIPRQGIPTDAGHKGFDEVVGDLCSAIGTLLGDDARAAALLGALVGPRVRERLEGVASLGKVVLEPRAVRHPDYPDAVVRAPALVVLEPTGPDGEGLPGEHFGPVSFAVPVESIPHALGLLRRSIRDQGAMTVAGYTTSPRVEAALEEVCAQEPAQLSLNLTGGVHINETAAFADLHGSGGNPSANVALCDAAFVANRFRTVQVRRPG